MWKYKQSPHYFEIPTDEIFILHKERCLWGLVYWSPELCISSTQLLKCSAIKNSLKMGLAWDVANFLVWQTQPRDNNSITVSLRSLKFFQIPYSIVRPAQEARTPQHSTGASHEYKFVLLLASHKTFCKNLFKVPKSLTPWIKSEAVVSPCNSRIASNS
jgi:hypothetical protein